MTPPFLENGRIYYTTDTDDDLKLIPVTHLKMSTATFNNMPLGGDAVDAVALGSGFYGVDSSATRMTERSFFAGIHDDADLGKELPTWISGQPVMAYCGKGNFTQVAMVGQPLQILTWRLIFKIGR